MGFSTKIAAAAIGALAVGGLAYAASPAQAAPPLVHATTHITNDPDSGGQGNWSSDDFTRTLDIYTDSGACTSISGFSAGDTCYSATISDVGTFVTLSGAYEPNQGSPLSNARITGHVGGKFSGSSGYLFYAPTGDSPSDARVPAALSGSPGTPTWFERAFAGSTTFGGGELNDWSWVYGSYAGSRTHACETWTDSFVNGDGQQPGDGNITGKTCVSAPRPPAPVAASEISSFSDYSASCLTADPIANSPVQLWTCGVRSQDQNFGFATIGGNQVLESLTSHHSGLCVTTPAGAGQLRLDPCTGDANQVVLKHGPYYVFTGDSDYVMDDAAWNTADGAQVIAYPENGGRNQKFSLP